MIALSSIPDSGPEMISAQSSRILQHNCVRLERKQWGSSLLAQEPQVWNLLNMSCQFTDVGIGFAVPAKTDCGILPPVSRQD